MVVVEIEVDDKLPLVEEVHHHQEIPSSNFCATFIKNLCLFISFVLIGFILAGATFWLIYSLTPNGNQFPSAMLDERCYAIISFAFPRVIQERSPQGLVEGFGNKINDMVVFEKLLHHQRKREQFYRIDPLLILKVLYASLTIVFLARFFCCCIFKGVKRESGAFWLFVVYYFALLSIMALIIVTTLPLLESRNPSSCDKQFWGY